MNTKEFLNLLSENQEKQLVFEYAKEQFVPKAYHITEVKNVYFESVDCGGNEHEERQTIVQLWSSPLERQEKYMESGKALKIIQKVDQIKPIKLDTEILFEYGNKNAPTSNYAIKKVFVDNDKIVLKMFVRPTVCKPIALKNLTESIKGCCGVSSNCC